MGVGVGGGGVVVEINCKSSTRMIAVAGEMDSMAKSCSDVSVVLSPENAVNGIVTVVSWPLNVAKLATGTRALTEPAVHPAFQPASFTLNVVPAGAVTLNDTAAYLDASTQPGAVLKTEYQYAPERAVRTNFADAVSTIALVMVASSEVTPPRAFWCCVL